MSDEKSKELESEIKNYKKQLEEKDSEVSELQKYKLESEAKFVKLEQEKFESDLESQVNALVADKTISPAMKPYAKALLGLEKKVYELKINDKEVKLSKADLVKELFTLKAGSNVNTKEESIEGKPIDQHSSDEKLIREYMANNGLKEKDYSKAYKAVMGPKLAQAAN